MKAQRRAVGGNSSRDASTDAQLQYNSGIWQRTLTSKLLEAGIELLVFGILFARNLLPVLVDRIRVRETT